MWSDLLPICFCYNAKISCIFLLAKQGKYPQSLLISDVNNEITAKDVLFRISTVSVTCLQGIRLDQAYRGSQHDFSGEEGRAEAGGDTQQENTFQYEGKYQVSSIKYQLSIINYQVSSIKCDWGFVKRGL